MADERMDRHQPVQGIGAKPRRPLPRWMFRVLNPAMTTLLRSPLHRLISHEFMLLSFKGRTSGQPYTVPVSYLQHDHRLYFSCLAGWWQNLPGVTVTVCLRGQDRRGTATRIVDPAAITEVVEWLIAKRGARMARRIGLLAARTEAEAGILPRRPVFIQIDLEDPTLENVS